MTLRERVSSREMLVLGSVLGPAKADAGRRQESESSPSGRLPRLKVGRQRPNLAGTALLKL